jgi:hypothetical protein
MSAMEFPALLGASGVPVTDRKPDSLWISRSYGFLYAYGPSLPYPDMSQTMSRGYFADISV